MVSEAAWPPPVDDATVWSTLRVRAVWPASEEVRVRTVRLWGRDVRIDEAGDVWCPSCQRFRTVAELGRPGNGCPVGIRWPAGMIWQADEEEMATGSRPWRQPYIDLLRASW